MNYVAFPNIMYSTLERYNNGLPDMNLGKTFKLNVVMLQGWISGLCRSPAATTFEPFRIPRACNPVEYNRLMKEHLGVRFQVNPELQINPEHALNIALGRLIYSKW